jgi:hypothetical protein
VQQKEQEQRRLKVEGIERDVGVDTFRYPKSNATSPTISLPIEVAVVSLVDVDPDTDIW